MNTNDLRSEKVQNLLGRIPKKPVIGSVVAIIAISLVLATCAVLFYFDYYKLLIN